MPNGPHLKKQRTCRSHSVLRVTFALFTTIMNPLCDARAVSTVAMKAHRSRGIGDLADVPNVHIFIAFVWIGERSRGHHLRHEMRPRRQRSGNPIRSRSRVLSDEGASLRMLGSVPNMYLDGDEVGHILDVRHMFAKFGRPANR